MDGQKQMEEDGPSVLERGRCAAEVERYTELLVRLRSQVGRKESVSDDDDRAKKACGHVPP